MRGHRPFVMWPDKRLRMAAAPVAEITDEVRAIWDEMVRAMEAMPGVGLAAVQLGIPLRLAVVDAGSERAGAVRMANPVIIDASREVARGREGSPNLPGVSAQVPRPARVSVRFLGADCVFQRRDFDGLWARSTQHQIDYLDGRMFFDRLSRVKREMLLRKAAKARAG